MRFRLSFLALLSALSCQQMACPSMAGGTCDPRNADCPKGYTCAIAEVCTHACEQDSDCWVKVTDGCRSNYYPGQLQPDGGPWIETSDDGFCPETKLLACTAGYCQRAACGDAGCDYDLYGPSDFKGNRSAP